MTVRDKVYVFAADEYGCGHYRMIWPAQYLKRARPDLADRIKVFAPRERGRLISAGLDKDDNVKEAHCPDDAMTLVFQRLTHRHLLQSLPYWQSLGVRCVVELDDDLSRIHPGNTAFEAYRPKPGNLHSWLHLEEACRLADAVVVTTPALARRYRPDAYVVPNYLDDASFRDDRVDSTDLMWPASMGNHPNDGPEIGRTLQRVVRETGARVRMLGGDDAARVFPRIFGVDPDEVVPYVGIDEWPALLASVGIGVAPLADTQFSAAKSWLKPLEMAAAGVPFVASPRADYMKLHAESGIGIFADRPSEWRRELKRLVQDDGWRREVSQKNRQAAEAYRLSLHAERWLAPWGLA